VTSGTLNASGLDITLTDNFDNPTSVIAKQFTIPPSIELSGNTLNSNNPYWIVETSATQGTYEASLTFNVPGSFASIGQPSVNQFKLYSRPIGSDGNWTLLKSSAASFTSTTVTFAGISQFGQFVLARDFAVDFDAVAGRSIQFDGTNDFIQVPYSSVMNLQRITIEFWIKWNRSGTAVDFVMSRGGEEWEIHLGAGSNGIRFIPRSAVYIDSQVEALTPGQWNHLAVVYDPAQSLGKIYVNGTDVTGNTSGNLSSSLINSSNALNLGRRQVTGDLHFAGEMDEFRVWNVARTQAQIQENMNRTLPANYYSDLVMYFQFNEGTGTSTSEIQNGLAGTLTNFDFNQNSGWATSFIPINQQVSTSITLTGQAGWRVLASPVQSSTIGSVLGSIWTQGFTGADVSHGTPNVYTWATGDGTKNQSNWTAAGNATDPMAPGQGVLVYVFRDDQGPGQVEGTFPKVLTVTGSVANTNQSLTARLNPNLNGWALLGNPFAANIGWNPVTRSGLSNSVYVYDPALDDWRTWNGSIGNLNNGEIGAFNAFFVETLASNPTLEIPATAQTGNSGGFLGRDPNTAEPIAFTLTLDSEKTQSGVTWFQFSEEGLPGLDASDAKKLNSLVPNRLFVASESEDGTLLAINHLPLDIDILEIPLHFGSPASGEHELRLDSSTLPADWSIAVTDRQLGTRVLLTEERPVYRFEHQVLAKTRPAADTTGAGVPELLAATGDEESRFVITVTSGPDAGPVRNDLPTEVALGQNYPNPFNPTTTIAYALPETAPVRLDVFDMLGRRVATLVNNEAHAPGSHSVSFDASRLTSGVYVYRLQAGSTVITRKFTLLK
jgi:hypothetical protein